MGEIELKVEAMSRIVTRLPTSLSNFITKTYFKGKNFTRFQ